MVGYVRMCMLMDAQVCTGGTCLSVTAAGRLSPTKPD